MRTREKMVRPPWATVLLVATLAAVGAASLFAQASATGEINGSVADPSGALVANAKVVLKNTETGAETATETNASGSYVLLQVHPGQYVMSVEATGFKRVDTEPFTIDVNQTAVRNVSLSVGTSSESITITAEAPQLSAATSELGTAIDTKSVVDLPLNGRNFTQILTLTPGATPIATAQGAGTGTGSLNDVSIPTSPAFRPSVFGAWNRSNLFYYDGILNTDVLYNGYAILPVVDAIAEFKVQSHNDQAEYGGVLGGIVNIVSKNGTNEFHGAGWEFLRNNAFDARNPFSDATVSGPPAFRQNQFGATVGGPVLLPKLYDGRNKSFFQFSWESWRYRNVNSDRYYVPTAAELGGDFSQSIINQTIYDPTTTVASATAPSGFVRTPFAGNMIPANRLNPLVVGWMQDYIDRPNYTGSPIYNVLNTREILDNSDSFQVRGDQRIGQNASVWGRYSRFNENDVTPDTLKHSTSVVRPRTNVGGGWTETFGAHIVADAKFGWLHHPYNEDQTFDQVGPSDATSLGFADVPTLGIPGLSLTSPWSTPGDYHGREADSDFQYGASVAWVKGQHTMHFGWDLLTQKRISGPNHAADQSYNFNNAQTDDPNNPGSTGASLASALLGLPSQFSYNLQNTYFEFPVWALWAQDEWKVNSKLTVNLGLRYDRLQPPSVFHGSLLSGWDISNGDWIIGGGKLPPACNTTGIAPCIPGNGNLADVANGNHIELAQYPTIRQPQTENFGPRLGIAYQFSPKMVVRGGYGISYDVYSGFIQDLVNQFGWWPAATQAQTSLNQQVGAPLVYLGSVNGAGGNPLPSADPWETSAWMSDPKKKTPMAHQWNVEVQRQMASNLALTVGYVGSHMLNLDLSGLADTATTPGPGTPAEVNARRPFPWAPTLFYGTSNGVADYNALEVKLDKRLAQGLQGLVSYTWSKVLDNGSSGYFASENGPGGSSSLQNYYDPNGSRAVAAYDITQFLSVSGVYDLPFGVGKPMFNKGAAAYLLGNWQVNLIAQIRSGQPYNLQVNGDVANIGSTVGWYNYARPNLVGDPFVSNVTPNQAFNAAAFAVPVDSYGNFGAYVLRSPYAPNLDLSLFKRFPIRENKEFIEFRAEAYNVLNIQVLGIPGNTLGNAGFGQITSTANTPRNIQLALKFGF